ncbi:LamG-like jellyroll fold domain-containing protein [Aquimarina sp. 2201CG5-10]|uniref:LamG-like jellyroll fold domain-containing protein n=1 Tax=Aquimarina callyspongiae TaxID=3098150 RepID=UPI002AB34D65|nr:LamG-like jellyroll fold domain-containing protein [Aquimarina sp. 2201CG5-10]MDY8135755.1 LamG-like jellyroll fold domain-containing protein [Aquimarina sp. 2201CG5-10]
MQNFIKHYIKSALLLLLMLYSIGSKGQDNRPAVLHIKGDNNYTTHYDTSIRLTSDLLDKDRTGEATIEFWAQAGRSGVQENGEQKNFDSWTISNLLTGSEEFSFTATRDQLTLKVGDQIQSPGLLGDARLFDDDWHHFAIVVTSEASTVAVYIDGIVRLVTLAPVNTIPPENLYMTVGAQDHLFVTEFRAWSRTRSREQIQETQFRSLFRDDTNSLSEFVQNGLVTAYVNEKFEEAPISTVPELQSASWDNILFSLNNSIESSRITTQYVGASTRLAKLRTDVDHPIFSLEDILLSASDGNGVDAPNSGRRNGVALNWPHIRGAAGYRVLRRNLSDEGTSSIEIEVVDNVQNNVVSELIRAFDSDILPNELYQYSVQAINEDGTRGALGRDIGFVFANGIVEGTIQTALNVATQDAGVEVIANTGVIPGSALEFRPETSTPIIINNVEIFRSARGEGTIEFWYKTPTSGSGSNTVFKLDSGEIRLDNNSINVQLNGGTYLEAPRPNDTEWHHYAVTFGASGGDIFIDGGMLPPLGEVGIRPNATTTLPFIVGLSRTSEFSFNQETGITYHLDEIRIWKGRRTGEEIDQYADYVLGGEVDDLLAYYRLDLNDPTHIYNQATSALEGMVNGTRGMLRGESANNLIHLSADQQPTVERDPVGQPEVRTPISYITFTDEAGRYRHTALNTGRQGITNNANSFEFKIVPSRPNHEFSPANRVVDIDRVLEPNAVTASFTDISALPVSGRIVYRVPDPSESSGFATFPSLQDTSIQLDGVRVNSSDPDISVTTNADGVYAITAAPGRHRFGVDPNTNTSSQNSGGGNTNSNAFDRVSLDFDGKTGYAVSSEVIRAENTDAFTWSGFIRPDLMPNPGETFSPIQTILHWGDLRIEVRNNDRLFVVVNDTDVLNASVTQQAQYSFFAVSVDPSNNTIALYVDNDYQTDVFSGITINSKTYLGAQNIGTGDTPRINFSNVNLDILEYRTEAYSQEQLREIQNGNVIADDEDVLALSYTFEHRRGTRAINFSVDNQTTENNFLSLLPGAFFNDASSSGYNRDFEFDYLAISQQFNPEQGSGEYVLNVIEPISDLNFENTSRRSFIGNIVVPCDNNVGEWTGTITRTDIAFPEFTVDINGTHFNRDRTVFTVNDLLPGQYRVELTNMDSGRQVQSSIIDLRARNQSFDFSFRNDIEIETTFYRYSSVEAQNEVVLDEAELRSRQIDPTCGTESDIYNLVAGEGVLISVKVFERYGDNICPVEGAEISLAGDMINDITGFNMKSNSIGRSNFIVNLGTPNFLEDFLRNLNIAVNQGGRNLNETRSAYLAGAQRSNSDFTLTDPEVGFVLFDPPGDGSSSTLERGSSFTFTKTVEGGIDSSTSFSTVAGSSTSVSTVALTIAAPLGVGAAAGVSTETVNLTTSPEFNTNISTTLRNSTGTTSTVTLDQSISTPTFDDYVGEDADVFIGTSQVLTFGTGRTLNIENCQPVIDNNATVMTADEQTPFMFTRQQIQDEVIPDLQRLLIARHDQLITPTQEQLDARSSLELDVTIDGFNIDVNDSNADRELVDYLFEIGNWQEIIKRPKDRDERIAEFEKGNTFSNTTTNLTTVDGNDLGMTVTELDQEIAFSSGPSITYNLRRDRGSSELTNGTLESTTGGGFNFGGSLFGANLGINTQIQVHTVVGGSDGTETANSRTDSFTLTDDDTGDQFNVRIRRHPTYDTPMFLTTAGQSMCPFESGTVPRQGVEISIDKNVGFGTGDETILYNITLRNTQRAADNTPKQYIVAMDGASNPLGAAVFLNESPIFEPATVSPITFALDGNSPTGVRQEVSAQLRIGRGTDAPSDISYENIIMRVYAACEFEDFNFQSFRRDEFEEVGVVPLSEILVTAHFSGPCIEEVIPDLPQENWVVNNTDNNELDFRFRIPEVATDTAPDGFTVDIEYAIEGNNTPNVLESLSLVQLKDNLQSDGFITYSADVSALTNGTYSFRVTPVCDDGGANIPASRQTPTPFVSGTISRDAPIVVSTNPEAGGVLTGETISATFSSAFNPATANSSTVSLRGILGGVPADLISAEFAEISDEVTIPHQSQFNITGAFTIEAWINPSRFPQTSNVPILKKNGNYKIELTPQGRIRVNQAVETTASLQPFTWTHVAAVYDGVNTIQVYYNGTPVGSGTFNGLVTNGDPIQIAGVRNGDSYVGLLDEVRIWTEARSPLEITTNLDRQLLGNETNLMAYFVFDDNALEGGNGIPDEAIRDFTGNAIGTTETGLSFVRGEGNAAPLDVTRMVQNLQFTITPSEGNTVLNIVPVFTARELEGARLTAMISDRKMQDPAGNLIAGASWDFIINRNALRWSQNNLSVRQSQGSVTRIENIDLVNEQGGTDINYRFVQLPAWLSVAEGANPTDMNRISAGQTNRNLVFEVAAFLNPGIHTANVNIETFNAATGIPLGVETFQLEVEVFCEAPAYTAGFNSGDFLGNMIFVGKLKIDGAQSLDTGDIVAAYLNGEFRGSASVGSNGLVNLSVFGNNDESGALDFRVWDVSECTEYQGITETYPYSFRGRFGSNTVPVTFTVGDRLTRRIPLSGRNQEVSFNVRDNVTSFELSLASITGLETGDRILDPINLSVIATVSSDGSYTSNVSTIDVRRSYLVQRNASANRTIQVSGIPVPVDTNIQIQGSNIFNAIPFFPNELQTTNLALRSLRSTTISEGDRIERRGLSAEYSTANGWVGSLTHLTPGLGYLYTATNAGTLNYSGIANTARSAVNESADEEVSYLDKAGDLGWTVDTGDYPRFMYMTMIVNPDHLNANKEYMIAAFVNGEISGITKPQYIEGNYHYFVGVGGTNEGKVTFKLFDGEKMLLLDNVVDFDGLQTVGNFNEPYELNYAAGEVVENNIQTNQVGYMLSQNAPNPMTSSTVISFSTPNDEYVDISLYNLLGQKVHTFMAKEVKGNVRHTIDWDGTVNNGRLSSGIYVYQLVAGDQRIQRKLVIK